MNGINIQGFFISTTVLASVAAGIGVILILLILLCCWLCRRGKHKGSTTRTTHSIAAENPSGASKGLISPGLPLIEATIIKSVLCD